MAKLQIAIQSTTRTSLSKQTVERFVQCTQRVSAFPPDYQLSIVLVGEDRMRRLNTNYRKKNKATNVLSFDYDQLSGEVVLCVPVIRRQAKTKGVSLTEELLYLLSHGLLHLQGFDHEGVEREAVRMEVLETRMMKVCYR